MQGKNEKAASTGELETPVPHKAAVKKNQVAERAKVSPVKSIVHGFAFALWSVVVFYLAQYMLVGIIWLFAQGGMTIPPGINETVLQTSISIAVYTLAIIMAIGVPMLVLRQKTTLQEMGLAQKLPQWRDIGLAPFAFIASMITASIAMYAVSVLVPGVDLTVEQQVGFESVTARYEMLLAFFTLVVLAPICEEVLFRGYMYGKMRRYFNAFWTILLTSVIFGALHLYGGQDAPLQWNAMVSITALAFFLGTLREYTKSIWASVLLHMLKNGVAFLILFVVPLLGLSIPQ